MYYKIQNRRAGWYVVKAGSGKIVSVAFTTRAQAVTLQDEMNAEQKANETARGVK